MANQYLILVTCVLFYISFFVGYQLALTFIDFSPPMKRTILPVLMVSVIAFISKICLGASAPIHTIIVVIVYAGVIHISNQTNILFSLIGSLLSVITLIFGSLILACPLFIELGYTIPTNFNGVAWLFLALLELIVPALVLIILKISKFSLINYFSITNKGN
jgi:hypothetical protein